MPDITRLAEFLFHLDRFLGQIVQRFGAGSYAILFLIIFCETGLVVTPLLPGDSLLFAAGTFAATGSLNLFWLLLLLSVAAILGDTLNYWIGRKFGSVIPVKPEHLEKTRKFYEIHGSKAVLFSRFVPIVRTVAPFVAGIGRMAYARFLFANVVGGILWVGIFVSLGYFFGNLPFVRKNFTVAILLIVFVSMMPGALEWWKSRRQMGDNRR